MEIIKDFSENQKNYLRYQSRLEAESVRNTILAEMEKARKEKETALKQAEQFLNEKEAARKQAEDARKEAERLLLLLKNAGIDPDQAVH